MIDRLSGEIRRAFFSWSDSRPGPIPTRRFKPYPGVA